MQEPECVHARLSLSFSYDRKASVISGAPRRRSPARHQSPHATFARVPGCPMAHVTCLLAARHALLASRQWDVEKEGLAGSPPIRILTSTEIHGSTVRAIRMLGLGEKHIIGLPIDANGRLREDALIAAPTKSPSIVILQAAALNIG